MTPEQRVLRDAIMELLEKLGLLPFAAQDVAESIVLDRRIAGQLRMLAGDAILLAYRGDKGLQD